MTMHIVEDQNATRSRFLTFYVDEEQYGIGIKHVIEIIGMQKITEIPEQPKYVNGIINLRGKIIPTIDIRVRFDKEKRPYDERTCIIVIDVLDKLIGIIVDQVSEVTTIDQTSISEPPTFDNNSTDRFINGIARVNEAIIILVNIHKIVADEVLKAIS